MNKLKQLLRTPIFWLTGILMVMLVVAGWQYWQVKKQTTVEAKTNCNESGAADPDKECRRKEGCCWSKWNKKCEVCNTPEPTCPRGQVIYCPEPAQYKCLSVGECRARFPYQLEPGPIECRSNPPKYKCRVCECVKVKPSPSPKPSPSVRPSPSPRPSPSVRPSPSPSLKTGKFIVRKFKDINHDGDRDWNDVSTGKAWNFKYRLNGGKWLDYQTNSFTGRGVAITVPANTTVEVKEINISGWINTTGLDKIKLIKVGQTYWFEFGNYKPGPKPSPSVSPSPEPSPEPGKASFVIRKFKDDDKDGSWDSNESSTGQDWSFQYRLNSDPWQDYWTAADSGWGGTVTVGLDTKVEVKEQEVSGWVNTTGLTKIDILSDEKVYYFDFGNFESPELVETVPPPQVPAAGAGFNWGAAALVIVGIGLQILAVVL